MMQRASPSSRNLTSHTGEAHHPRVFFLKLIALSRNFLYFICSSCRTLQLKEHRPVLHRNNVYYQKKQACRASKMARGCGCLLPSLRTGVMALELTWKGKKPSPASCPLTSTYVLWHTHNFQNIQILTIKILKQEMQRNNFDRIRNINNFMTSWIIMVTFWYVCFQPFFVFDLIF